MQSTENIQEYEFFAPGEICFFFEHDPKHAEEIDAALRNNQTLWRLIDEAGFRCLDVRTYTGSEREKSAYSLVCAQLPAPSEPNVDQRNSLNERVIRLVDEVFTGIQERRFEDRTLRLTGVTPNWYSGAAQQLIDGGPGAKPVDAHLAPDDLKPLQSTAVDAFIAQQLIAQGRQRDCEVDVYVLDSIPLVNSWKNALRRTSQSAPLLDLLSKLTIRSASDLGVVLPDSHHEIAGHLYEMSDHGLFIAGLIHDSAPDANIYLLEVLNKYGVGTMMSLLAGLMAVPTHTKRPTIINCSLMMAARSAMLIQKFPDWKRMREAEPDDQKQTLTPKQLRLPMNKYLAALMQPLEKLIQQRIAALSADQCVRIVAAAGNDGRQGEPRPPARYPAAFPKVIGVSAQDNKGQDAVYSNYADNPLNEGIATFGGAVSAHNATLADGANGIAGLYIGEFPGGAASNGTARWAGTSFATGVVSGLLAKLLSNGCDCDTAEEVLRSEHPDDSPDAVSTSTP